MKINLDRFKELSDGDPASFLDLVQLYLTKTAEQIKELETRLQTKASGEVARIAHSMVGANAMVGMDTLLPPLKKLERQGEQDALSEAQNTFEEICQEFKLIQTRLEKETEVLSHGRPI